MTPEIDKTIDAQTEIFAKAYDPTGNLGIMTAAYIDGEFVFVSEYGVDPRDWDRLDEVAKKMLAAGEIKNTETLDNERSVP